MFQGVPRPLPTMLSDKVRTWKEGIQGIHLSGGERGIQRGGGNFPGISLSNFLVDIHGLTLNLDSHENRP